MHDKVKITVVSGDGGNGAIAFRREKSTMNGGPYGGNGGRGGNISFIADNGIDTLSEYRFGKVFKAECGQNGKSKLQYGKDASDITLHVPVGTVVEDVNGNQLADLYHHGDTYMAVKGGRGGRGNATFKSATRRTPNIAENGMPGETKELYLELKLLADVGLVGYPNAGKSTLLSAVTRAKAEVAPYAFTTLEPQLGVCFIDQEKSFVLADLPGLIDGASQGKGLGHTFLRHIERCRVLLHIIDIAKSVDPYKDFIAINEELRNYRPELLERRMIIALNKTDLGDFDEKIEGFKEKIKDDYEIYEISAKDNKGLYRLTRRLYKLVEEAKLSERKTLKNEDDQEEKVYTAKNIDTGKIPDYQIVRRDDGSFEILGDRVIRTKRLINITTDEGMDKLLRYLDRIKIDERLKKAGCHNGDTVILDGFEFDYFE